jgi:phospho-N-acetylmuramoyl-pentapeptide-transferase
MPEILSVIRIAPDMLNDILTQTNLRANLDPRTMVSGLLMGALSFILAWLIGRPVLKWLRAKKIGKRIQEELPEEHKVKSGTPTMGGLMIIAAVLIISVVFILIPTWVREGRPTQIVLPILVLLTVGFLGAVDDLLSLVGKGDAETEPSPNDKWWQRTWRKMLMRRGLSARAKMGILLVIGVIVAAIMVSPLVGLTKVYIPFNPNPVDIGWLIVPAAIFIFTGTANAVNFTDGLDTLAGSTCVMAFTAYGIIGFLQDQPQVVFVAFAVAGACMGFLWYNAHPAMVFMGDTGSLTLGALLAVLAFQTNQWLLLPIVGAVFMVEALSVILQVGYFKLTKGKRLFRMAPIHLHFQKSGWSENQVTMRFFLLSTVAMMISVALALL